MNKSFVDLTTADFVLNRREVDGVKFGKDPSRFNPFMTYRHALDVIAATSVSPEVIHRGLDSITALRGLTENRTDRMIVLVEDDPVSSYNGLYHYDEQETAAESLPFVVEPNDGVGRWIQISKRTVAHNALGLIQGGVMDERYHLTQGQNQAAAGSVGAPGSLNRYVTEQDERIGNRVLFEAVEELPAFSLVAVADFAKSRKADSGDALRVGIGISSVHALAGDFHSVITHGFVRNPMWSFPAANVELFLSVGGSLTSIPPTTGYLQSIGRVADVDTILLSIGRSVRL